MDLDKIGAEATRNGRIDEVDAWAMIALIRKQEAALGATQPAQPVATVDGPVFNEKLTAVCEAWAQGEGDFMDAQTALLDHFDAHTAQAVAAAQAEAESWRKSALHARGIINELRGELEAAPQQHAQAALSDERESQTVTQLRKSLAGWQEECEVLRHDRDGLRQRLDLQALHQKNDVWYWQGDGTDYPESISNSMAVVIRGDQLRAILTASTASDFHHQ